MKPILSTILVLFALISCSRLADINPLGNNNAPQSPQIQNINGKSPKNVLAVVRLGVDLGGFVSNLPVNVPGFTFPTIDFTTAVGNFSTDVGEIKLKIGEKEYALEKAKNKENFIYTYATGTSFRNLTGSENALGIELPSTGNVNYQAIFESSFTVSPSSATTVTIPGQLKVTSPAVDQEINRADGLSISFTVTNANRYAAQIIDSKGNTTILKESNSKSITFTTDELSSVSKDCTVSAIAYNFKEANNGDLFLIGQSVGQVQVRIN